MAENTFGSQSVTQTTTATTQESARSISVTLHMPFQKLKILLEYLKPEEVAQLIKIQADEAQKILKGGKKDISDNQVYALNQQMANSLQNMIAKFREQICQSLQMDPINDSKETKLFKVRANKHVIAVLEGIGSWLKASLEKVSAPSQSVEEKVKEYDEIICELKIKIKQLQTDKLSVEIDSLESLPSKHADLKNNQKVKENESQNYETSHSKDEEPTSNGNQTSKKGKEANQEDKTANGQNTDKFVPEFKILKIS